MSLTMLLLRDRVGDLGETMRSTVHCGPGPTDEIESDGLRNEVSNESFTGSGRATERREGDGRRIEDSYVLSVSLAQVLPRIEGGGGEGGAGGEGSEICVGRTGETGETGDTDEMDEMDEMDGMNGMNGMDGMDEIGSLEGCDVVALAEICIEDTEEVSGGVETDDRKGVEGALARSRAGSILDRVHRVRGDDTCSMLERRLGLDVLSKLLS
jgi:hypothetical protein